MKESIRLRLQQVTARHEEIALLLSEPEVFSDQNRYRDLSREYAQLEPLILSWRNWQQTRTTIDEAAQMMGEPDPELRQIAREELEQGNSQLEKLEQELQLLLLPRDPNDDNNIFLEIRAGTGGDEAAIFAGDLFRMYQKYVEGRGWSMEILNENPGEHGGFKEIVSRVAGQGAYSRFKFESGTHRVQRVPETESQGRIHTSACTVAILPEVEGIEEININPADLRTDTFRASVPAVSMSTRRIRPYVLPISPAASSSNARMKGRSTRTAREPCHCCRRACSNRSRADKNPKLLNRGVCRSVAATGHSVFGPIISHRAG